MTHVTHYTHSPEHQRLISAIHASTHVVLAHYRYDTQAFPCDSAEEAYSLSGRMCNVETCVMDANLYLTHYDPTDHYIVGWNGMEIAQ